MHVKQAFPASADPMTQIGAPHWHRLPALYASSADCSRLVTAPAVSPRLLRRNPRTYSPRSIGPNPSGASTFVTPPNPWPRVLPNVVNPAWNSFTLVGDRTTILEPIYCCEVVDRLVPCSGNDEIGRAH